jgi:flagellar hook-associated protein 1 FlgK
LKLAPDISQGLLASTDPGPPAISNGIPLRLAKLASPETDEDRINGVSFTQFYGRMAGRVGSELSAATDKKAISESTVAQAKSLRQQLSGVSFDEEAMILVEFQRAYQANARVLTALDEMLQQTINAVNP